jgi:hypothetical protein
MRRMPAPAPEPPPRAAAPSSLGARTSVRWRTRVAILALSVFVAAWAMVFVRLVEGHDPGLASIPATVVSQSADPDVTDDPSGNSPSPAAPPGGLAGGAAASA